ASLYLTGMWSKVLGGFGLVPNGGIGPTAPIPYLDINNVWHNTFGYYITQRPQKQYRLDGSKFFDIGSMNHELKFGFGYRSTPVTSSTTWPGPAAGFWELNSVAASDCTAAGLPANCQVAAVTRASAVAFGEK